eukprot:COSAG01_NODE_7_length_54400_cov_1218.054935_33_plen_237_part_00
MLSCLTCNLWANIFYQAEKAYQEKDYERAKNIYLQCYNPYVETPELCYNLGNTYLKLEDYGQARLFYKKAQKWHPRDSQIKNNLAHLESKLIDQELLEKSLIEILLDLLNLSLTLNESYLLFLISLSLVSLYCLLQHSPYKNQRFQQKLKRSILLLFIISSILLIFKYQQDYLRQKAIITNKKTSVHSGPSDTLPVLFFLHEGSEIKCLKAQEKWKKIEAKKGLTGWVNNTSLEQI